MINRRAEDPQNITVLAAFVIGIAIGGSMCTHLLTDKIKQSELETEVSQAKYEKLMILCSKQRIIK